MFLDVFRYAIQDRTSEVTTYLVVAQHTLFSCRLLMPDVNNGSSDGVMSTTPIPWMFIRLTYTTLILFLFTALVFRNARYVGLILVG